MSSTSVFSHRRSWDGHRGAISSAPYPSSRAPASVRGLRGGGECQHLDLVKVSSDNSQLLLLRSQEREQLVDLNDRFANYIEKVRHLEQQNRCLLAQLEALRRQHQEPPRLQALYNGQVRSLRAAIDSENVEKRRMEAERDYLRGVLEQTKERYEEEAARRLDAEEALHRAREDASRSELQHSDADASLRTLWEELLFHKKVFAAEQAQLQAQLQTANISVEVELPRPDLSTALRDIRLQYEALANGNMRSAEEWYRHKFANVAEIACKNNEAVHAVRLETMEYRRLLQSRSSEIDGLHDAIDSLSKQLEELEENQAGEVNKYQEKIMELEHDISDAKQEMTHHLREYQDLLNVKMALDIEIAAYRKLLEGEELRLAAPPLPPAAY